MIEKTCRCGKTKKNFKIDIGPFFVDECCLEAGYDEVGNRVKKELNMPGLPSEEELLEASKNLKDDSSPEPEDPSEELEVKSERQETNSERRAREKAEKKAAKAAKAEVKS